MRRCASILLRSTKTPGALPCHSAILWPASPLTQRSCAIESPRLSAARALSYVADSVREFDPTINDERCRTIMGSLGLVGEKAIRPISSLSGGEKARVALVTFCLTPYNVLLLDEPTNHLDVQVPASPLE